MMSNFIRQLSRHPRSRTGRRRFHHNILAGCRIQLQFNWQAYGIVVLENEMDAVGGVFREVLR